MSRKSNSSRLNNPEFLFPEMCVNNSDDLFCVSYFKSNPDKLDLRNPSEKLKDCQDRLQSEDLSPQEKFSILSQINSIQKMVHSENSVEFLRSEAELGYFYNENMNPQAAIRHLEKAHSLEKHFKIDQEESVNIAAETALAYLLLGKKSSNNLTKAHEALNPYYNTKIENPMIRFKRDLSRSRIFSGKKKYTDAVQSYTETISSLQEVNENQHSAAEAQLYLEQAKVIEAGSKSIPDSKEKASECYMNAHKVFMAIGDEESANKIDPNKLPQHYKDELENNHEEETEEQLLKAPLDTEKIEFVSKDDKPFEETPDQVRKEIIKFQRNLGNNKVRIQYLPKNESDVDGENEKDSLPVPPPSEVVEEKPSPSQIYLLTHDQLPVPKETDVKDVKKFTETDEAAQTVSDFNNAILQSSRYKMEMEKSQNNKKSEPDPNPLEIFRSSRRRRKINK